jgi:hypothetical protein
MPARWATAVVRIEALDAADDAGSGAGPAAHGRQVALVRVQVGIHAGSDGEQRRVLGPRAVTRAQAGELVGQALDGIYAAIDDSSRDEAADGRTSRNLPGHP